METSQNSMEANLNESISLPGDSHVRMSPIPASAPESRVNVLGCGLNSSDSFAHFDQESSLWRTYQGCLQGGLAEYSETWPRAGMMRSGKAYQLQPLALRTSATGFGYLPTPDASLGKMNGGPTMAMDALSCYRKATTGKRPSGTNIGSSLRWCQEFINEWLRTGGFVNPAWLEALMGFPENWWTLPTEPSETQSSPR